MEDRVKNMIKMIDEDADSFAKKAEMYFKRRPELIYIVEENYRSYKSLADRYDRLSSELHKANNTIATAFPDQVPALDDEEDYEGNPARTFPHYKSDELSRLVPKVPPPEIPRPNSRIIRRTALPPLLPKRPHHVRGLSDITPEGAKQEIDRLQKKILACQTEKEFVKSSYEKGLAKYWDIEDHMTQMQQEICQLQELFCTEGVIEDDEARALMTATALKSCEDSLIELSKEHVESAKMTREASERIRVATMSLESVKGGNDNTVTTEDVKEEDEEGLMLSSTLEMKSLIDSVKAHFAISSDSTIAEVATKIDRLVEKVIHLEMAVSTEKAQLATLKDETEEVIKNLGAIEEGDDDELTTQVEERLQRILDHEKNVHDLKGVVQSQISEACKNFNKLCKKLQSPESEQAAESEKTDENSSELQGDHGEDKDRDTKILNEYTSIIQNYKDTRKKLIEMEKKSEESLSETLQQMQELRCANAIKDEEIKSLRKKLFSADQSQRKTSPSSPGAEDNNPDQTIDEVEDSAAVETTTDEGQTVYNMENIDRLLVTSPLEDKFRADIEALLEENLDFWLRFSTSYHQIQKFCAAYRELRNDAEKELEAAGGDGDKVVGASPYSLPSDRKLRELNTELQVWSEHNEHLQAELRTRYESLCTIQEEITKCTQSGGPGEDEDMKFTPYQAARFQGEVINMQQENNKVSKELQAGLDHIRSLQMEVGKTLSKLRENFEMTSSVMKGGGGQQQQQQYNQFRHLNTKSKVPLKTFLFAAAKPKKQSLLFSCINPANDFKNMKSFKGAPY